MADMTITSKGPRECKVRLSEGDGGTSHRVTVPEDLIQYFAEYRQELRRRLS